MKWLLVQEHIILNSTYQKRTLEMLKLEQARETIGAFQVVFQSQAQASIHLMEQITVHHSVLVLLTERVLAGMLRILQALATTRCQPISQIFLSTLCQTEQITLDTFDCIYFPIYN
jgi:hypothetical protein